MDTQRFMAMRRFGLILVLLCIWCIPHLAGAAPLAQIPTGPLDAYNGTPDYYTTANWANSPPLAKFVNSLAPLGCTTTNDIGQCIPVAVADTTTFPGSDYYIIKLTEYSEKMHSDLNPTKLRGYVQLNAAGAEVAPPHYLGPIIVATKDRPVRIKFINGLPTGAGGDLFIPVDTTVMGAGPGPIAGENFTQNRADIHLHGGRTPWISDGTPHQWITPANETTSYVQGVSKQNVPDMCFDSSGNAIPRSIDPDCLTGSSDPGPGAVTYYFTNQQSTRLMFYHDHAWGITRLNVYAGEAAGYIITDPVEQDLVTRGIIPADQIPLIIQDKSFVNADVTTHPAGGGKVMTVRETDPLWNWGSQAKVGGVVPPVTGDLWMPHVYMPAQMPAGSNTGGVNPFGRWMYGPWFFPATQIVHGPVANPYYDPDCSSPNPFILAQCQTPGQPPLIPGTPNVSMGMEAFHDTAVVNGTVFPSLTVDPKAYRFRILNAAGDRFQNLSFYIADPAQVSPDPRPASRLTEVKMATASAANALANNWPANWPIDGRAGGVPDPGLCAVGGVNCPNFGPTFLQIGTEGGFLPKPVLIEHQPITYITDPTAFWVGNVDKMGLALGPAERADVIVDFSAYAGKTLILYNDAPAAWPAGVVTYDYYTGAPDLRDSGGYGTGGTFDPATGSWIGGTGPLAGYAPNIRTVMQVIVRAGSNPAFDQTALMNEFTSAAQVTALNPAPVKTVFERSQEPIIVGQAAYSTAYPNSYFPANFPWEGVNQINDPFLQFVTLAGEQVKVNTEPKGIHDEMGASFDPEYGRMSGNLAMQIPNPTTLTAVLNLYGFSDIPSETVNNSPTVNVQVLPNPTTGLPGTLNDGTQIWKISHNGVDTHPIHFHIFDVQLINRVGWDGQILMPEPNELGWKDTVKISPLEDTIVAVRPRAPLLPFGIPNSLRPLNPGIPIDSAMGFTTPTPGSDWFLGNGYPGGPAPGTPIYGFSSIDFITGQAYPPDNPAAPTNFPYPNFKGIVTNVLYDFGWEYVWHCHILSHEEMDMMRPIVLKVESALPPAFTATAAPSGGRIVVTWNDPTPVNYATYPTTFGDPANEVGFNVYRSTDGVNFTKLNSVNLPANTTSYADTSLGAGAVYKVEAFNSKGSTYTPITSSLIVNVSAATAPFTAPATVNLNASVIGLSQIVSVGFYNGATLLGTATTAPYTISWPNVMGGTYNITAKVTDSLGAVTVSAPLAVTVTGTIFADFTITGSTPVPFGFCDNNITLTSTSTGIISSYSWSIGGTSAVTTFPAGMIPGIYPVTLTISKANGETAQITKDVTVVNHNPIAIPGGPYTVMSGTTVTLNGSGTDLLDACNTTPLTYAWNVDNKGPYEYFTANPTISFNVLQAALGYGTHTMTLQVTDSNGGVGTATTTLLIVGQPSPVTITSPATGASFTQGTATPITVSVPTAGGSIAVNKVDFYANAILIGTSTTAPFSFTWTPATGGAFSLTATATYSNAMTTTSPAVAVTVSSSVVITAPASGATLALNAPIVITATATAPTGTTTILMEFFADGVTTPIGFSSVPPYSFSWTTAAAGAHSLTATAYYSNGTSSTSAALPINVLNPITTAPSLIGPSGIGITTTPTFTVNAVANASAYVINLSNLTTGISAGTVFTAAQGGTACAAGSGTCSFTLATPLIPGNGYGWQAAASNALGRGPWSSALYFTVTSTVPVAPTIAGPSGANISDMPIFTVNAVANASAYVINLSNLTTGISAGNVFTAAQGGTACAAGSGTCSFTLATPLIPGNGYGWQAAASNALGRGPWSSALYFAVTSTVPVAPTMSGPSGAGITTTPTFTVNAVANASAYVINLSNLTTGISAGTVFTAAQGGTACAAGSGTCNFTLATPLIPGNLYGWQAAASNTLGRGPWSSALFFTVASTVPVAPTIAGPSGANISDMPTFTVNAVANASAYVINLSNLTSGISASTVFIAAQGGTACAAGSGTCGFTLATPLIPGDSYDWQAAASNALGQSQWSSALNFTVTGTVPVTPTISGPSGAGITTTPTFTVSAVANASAYVINLSNLTTGISAGIVFTAAQGGTACAAGSGTCGFTLATPLILGDSYGWQAAASNTLGRGPWSSALYFAAASTVPVAPTISGPSGANIPDMPTFTVNAVANASAYVINYTNFYTNISGNMTFTAAQGGTACAAGSGTCSFTLATPLIPGNGYGWQAAASNALGRGPWSSALYFAVTSTVPVAPTISGPSGAGITTTPTFTVSAVANASAYVINLSNLTTGISAGIVFTAAQGGTACAAGSGTCSFTLATPLVSGNDYGWQAAASNALGQSPWSSALYFTPL